MGKNVLIKSEYKKLNICGTTVNFENGVATIPFSLFEKTDSKLFELVEEDEVSDLDLKKLSITDLRDVAKVNNISLSGAKSKADILKVLEGALYGV